LAKANYLVFQGFGPDYCKSLSAVFVRERLLALPGPRRSDHRLVATIVRVCAQFSRSNLRRTPGGYAQSHRATPTRQERELLQRVFVNVFAVHVQDVGSVLLRCR
jgi:hypothetical protein